MTLCLLRDFIVFFPAKLAHERRGRRGEEGSGGRVAVLEFSEFVNETKKSNFSFLRTCLTNEMKPASMGDGVVVVVARK